MEVVDLPLEGLKLVRPALFRDQRGFVLETYRESSYRSAGIDATFVQDNHSRSLRGTVRGLHYQVSPGQAKLVWVTSGSIFDAVVDIRRDSPTFGQSYGVTLRADDFVQLFVPVGFAHGYAVLSDVADVTYKLSSPYEPATEAVIRWDDPDLAVAWPDGEPILSTRDQQGENFADFAKRVRGR